MTIQKWQNIICDWCGNVDYFQGDQNDAYWQARKNGWIITANKKHYDTEDCYKSGTKK